MKNIAICMAASCLGFCPQAYGVTVDASGNLFIADSYERRIRKVSASGIITTVAGGGNPPSGLGDGGPSTSALLVQPYGVVVDASGNLFIADTGDNRIRKAPPRAQPWRLRRSAQRINNRFVHV